MSKNPNNLIPESVPARPDDGREMPTVFTNRFTVHVDGGTVRMILGETFAVDDPRVEWRAAFIMSLENFRNLLNVSNAVVQQIDRDADQATDRQFASPAQSTDRKLN